MRSPILANVDLPLSSGRFEFCGLPVSAARVSGDEETPARARKSETLRIGPTPILHTTSIKHSGNRILPQPEWALAARRSRAVIKHRPDRRHLFAALRQLQVIEYRQGDSRRWNF